MNSLSPDQHISGAKDKAVEIFSRLSDELRSNIESLSRNTEWDTFTIALYGETNAGKSTIIETMRILLREPGKMEQQAAFRALEEKHGVSMERLAGLRQAVEEADRICAQFQDDLNMLDRRFQARTQELRDTLQALRSSIRKQQENASVWQKFLHLFIRLPEQKQLALHEAQLQDMDAERMRSVLSMQQEQQAAQQEQASRVQSLRNAEAAIAHLAEAADGAIIGNGKPDFTQVTTPYTFANGAQQFALLDVPGIEGKEDKVMEAIWTGVQKAHAVFYVTGKAAAPQKGDGQQQGTLEKIRQHLGAQTEVWTIYNKRVTNPMQLGGANLSNEDEQASLRELDGRMQEVLGDKYRGTLTVSAYPAFLAAASCLVPDSQAAAGKAKFMAKFSQEELLRKSGIAALQERLSGELVVDFRSKIKRSNFNKARQVVCATQQQVALTLQESFEPLAKELEKDAAQAQLQLDTALDALKSRLESQGESAISGFTNSVRRKIYDEIATDIGNDEFKDAFDRFIRREQAALVEKLPGLMQKEVTKFQEQIADIIERFQNFATELLDAYGSMRIGGLGASFDLKIDIDNGINLPGLLGAVVGGAILLLNPASWPLLALGAVTALVGVAKAVIGFFSADYKKSQQRKAADSNLDGIADKMRESLRDSLASALPQLEPKIEALKEALDKPAAQVADIVAILGKSERQLKALSKSIDIEGGK